MKDIKTQATNAYRNIKSGARSDFEVERKEIHDETPESLLRADFKNPEDYFCGKCYSGWVYVDRDGYEFAEECSCQNIVRSLRRIKNSGLAPMLSRFGFDNYKAEHDWQRDILSKAVKYAKQSNSTWFYIGGAVGAGKTHICTSIAKELMFERSLACRYVVWRELMRELKSVLNTPEYNREMDRLSSTKVLYIDDFLKVAKGATPTDADIQIAFEIINHRYNKDDTLTIFSSEQTLKDVHRIDPAVGSRIYERSNGGEFIITLEPTPEKNIRYRGTKK